MKLKLGGCMDIGQRILTPFVDLSIYRIELTTKAS